VRLRCRVLASSTSIKEAAVINVLIALGWLTVTSHWLLTGALVPASATLTTTERLCKLVYPPNRPIRPVVAEIRDWIVEQMRNDLEKIDRLYPKLGLLSASY
jgi:DNA-binding transcriptional LysR family regulator